MNNIFVTAKRPGTTNWGGETTPVSLAGLASILFFLVSSLQSPSSSADVPRLIHYQGKLVTSSGSIVAGPVGLRVRLYNDPVAASPVLFDESHAGVQLNRSLFSVLIGSQTGGGVPDSVLAGSSVYLGLAVDGATELAPRIRIATAPFAGKTKSAEQLVKPNTVDPGVTLDAGGRVGVGTTTPDASALVDMSSTSGGLLPPRMTTAQRDAIASPATGLMVFNTTTNCLNLWSGTAWTAFGAPQSPGAITGSIDLCAGDSGIQYSVSDVPGAQSYTWSVPQGSTITSGQGTAFITVDLGGISGAVSVIASNACGASAASSLPVEVSASPPSAPGTISGPTTFSDACDSGSTGSYSISAVAGATSYTWTAPMGATILNGQGTTSATILFGSVRGNVSVAANNACGSGPSNSITIISGQQTLTPTGTGRTGSIQSFTVPACVTSLRIEAWGAGGGFGAAFPGGLGARMRGDFAVAPGDTLRVLVGHKGGDHGSPGAGGGGGGTFVATASNTPLLVAGGGSGGCANGGFPGQHGLTGTSGGNSSPGGVSGGSGGGGGAGGGSTAGGGGFTGNGAATSCGSCAPSSQGGRSFLNGGDGGCTGSCGNTGGEAGFGGGTGGEWCCVAVSGAGGGYSGGAGGAGSGVGGGGGSYNAGSNQDNASGVRADAGQVVITW